MKFRKTVILSSILLASSAMAVPNGTPFQDLQEQINKNTALIQENTASISELQESVSDIQTRLDGVDTQISALEDQVTTNSTDIADAIGRLSSAEVDIDTLKVDLKELVDSHKEDVGSINDQLSSLAQEIANLNNAREALADELHLKLKELSDLVASNSSNIELALLSVVTINGQLTSISNDLMDLESRHETLSDAFDLMSSAYDGLVSRVADLEAITDTLSGYHLYTFSGIAQDVPVSSLMGWQQCYSGVYGGNYSLATLQADCSGSKVMLACRPTGSDTLTIAAYANREDVFYNTGNGNNVVHNANGVDWYYSDSYSMGFAPQGAGVLRHLADIQASGAFGSSYDNTTDLRLSWHTNGGSLIGGWRCGASMWLNSALNWERVVYTAD